VSRLVAAYHAVKLAGLVTNLVAFPRLRAVPDRADRPRTSLLVPARDEAHRLPGTLAGLLAQPADEILVLDDGSTDATPDVVRAAARTDARVRLVRGCERPIGWAGKTWACHRLAAAARGDLLVFCDADVTLAPGALAAGWARMAAERADVFSVFPRQRTGTLGERLLVPLVDEALLAFLPYPLLRAPVPAAAAANGQLLAFRRAGYESLGGHAAVAGAVVEDLALARLARRYGLRLRLALGADLVSARMYGGYADAVRGFGKSMREAHGGSDALLIAAAGWRVAAYTLPWLRSGRTWRFAAAAGLAERLLVNAATGRGIAEAGLVPVGALAALPVYAVALRRTARWKGREYR
jgi:glycosyltransferase involved in cell wall biosynthesis